MITSMYLLLFILVFICIYLFLGKMIGQAARKRLLENSANVKTNIFINKTKFPREISAGICVLIIVLAVVSGNTIIKSIFYGLLGGGIYLWLIRIKKEALKKEVLQDLFNVAECLRVQLSSQISLKTALRSIPELCKNKLFSQELSELYLEYELSKFTVATSVKVIQEKFNYPEIQVFISAINQQTQGTSAIEALDNLIEILKEKCMEYMEEDTKSKVTIMTAGVFVIVLNLAALGIYPVAIEILESAQNMLS